MSFHILDKLVAGGCRSFSLLLIVLFCVSCADEQTEKCQNLQSKISKAEAEYKKAAEDDQREEKALNEAIKAGNFANRDKAYSAIKKANAEMKKARYNKTEAEVQYKKQCAVKTSG